MNLKVLLSFLIIFLSIHSSVQGQEPPEPQGPGGPNPPPPGLVVPIDEGAHWLVAAGLLLGVVFLKKKED